MCNSTPPPVGNREGKEEDADGADEGVHAELVLGRRAGGAVAAAAAVALFYCALHLRARRARLEAGARTGKLLPRLCSPWLILFGNGDDSCA